MPTPMSKPALPDRAAIDKLVADALREDLGDGDLTAALLASSARARARLLCREPAVLCGAAWFEAAFHQVDAGIEITWLRFEGERIGADEAVCDLNGRARAIVTAERTAINLLQTLSGTATETRRYVDAVAAIHATTQGAAQVRVMDTRKTLPGLRAAQKYAVAVGGGRNHRMGLFDQILLKENHIAAAGSIAAALEGARRSLGAESAIEIEIEVESLAQLQQALDAGARHIMLDNMDAASLRDAVKLARGRAKLEASGKVSLQTLGEIAATGVDYISVGALTKHLKAIDFSLRFMGEEQP